MKFILPDSVFEWFVMTEFIALPLQTKALLALVLMILALIVVRMAFNLIVYVWAICAMPTDKRIEYITHSKTLAVFKKAE